MRNKFIAFILSGIFLGIFLASNVSGFSVDPNIDMLISGPFKSNDTNSPGSNKSRERFRVFFILNEVSLKLFVQKISYGEENCCATILSTYEIDDVLLEGENKLYRITDFQWLTYNSFSFTGNSSKYLIKDIDSKYNCIRL